MRGKLLALVYGDLSRQSCFPIGGDEGLQRVGIEVLWIAEHDVGLQAFVEQFGIRSSAGTKRLLEARLEPGQESVLQQAPIGGVRCSRKLVALIETERHRHGHDRGTCVDCESSYGLQRRQERTTSEVGRPAVP